jgi:hypothetical protein
MMWRMKRTILIFRPFSMHIGIALCTRAKKKLVVNMQWIVGDFIENGKNNCSTFTEVIIACEHHRIKDVMELKYDWNDEVGHD